MDAAVTANCVCGVDAAGCDFVVVVTTAPPPTNEPVAPLPIPADQVDAWINQGSPAIEDHDTLANFEPLNELPAPVDADDSDAQL